MDKRDQSEVNVVSLEQAKKQAEQKQQEDSLSRYLGILSFSQLINEASNVIRQLDAEKISRQTTTKSKLVLKELSSRIEKQSGSHLNAFGNMKKQLDLKIKNIQNHL